MYFLLVNRLVKMRKRLLQIEKDCSSTNPQFCNFIIKLHYRTDNAITKIERNWKYCNTYLKTAFQDFFSLSTAYRTVDCNFFVTTDTKRSYSVTSLWKHGLLTSQLFQYLQSEVRLCLPSDLSQYFWFRLSMKENWTALIEVKEKSLITVPWRRGSAYHQIHRHKYSNIIFWYATLA